MGLELWGELAGGQRDRLPPTESGTGQAVFRLKGSESGGWLWTLGVLRLRALRFAQDDLRVGRWQGANAELARFA